MSRRFVELENIIDFVLVDFTGTCCVAIPKLSKVGVHPTESGNHMNHRESKFGHFSHITTTTTSIILSPCLLVRFHPYPPHLHPQILASFAPLMPMMFPALRHAISNLAFLGVGPFLMMIFSKKHRIFLNTHSSSSMWQRHVGSL